MAKSTGPILARKSRPEEAQCMCRSDEAAAGSHLDSAGTTQRGRSARRTSGSASGRHPRPPKAPKLGRSTGGAIALLAALMTASASMSLPALAALGGDAASVDADAAKMKAQKRATAAGGYTVSEITLPSGTVVREYISAEGKVFAVTWSGVRPPDLQQTLGAYFAAVQAAAAAPHAGHNHLDVRQDDLVVSSSGHMRASKGKAYVPSLLPPNFSVDEIK
jgi:hypothetical protein